MRDRVMSAHASLKSADVKVAIFGHFYGKDLYLDLEKTDRDQILRVLSAEVAACRIRYPFVHWRQLYDKYYDAYRSNSISPWMTVREFAPRYSSRGIASRQHSVRTVRAHRVKVSRLISPTTVAPLAHCRNTDCQSIHGISLMSGDTSAGQAYKLIAAVRILRHRTNGAMATCLGRPDTP